MNNVKIINRKVRKMALKELCNIIDNQNNLDNDIIYINENDSRMCESMVDTYLHRRFIEKSKILCKK